MATTIRPSRTRIAAAKLRITASSVAPGLASPSAPCVLAWLGAREPGIHQCHQESH